MSTVTMFVLNNCDRDARVLKEARSLTEAGYAVRIIATLDNVTVPHEVRDGFVIDRVVRNPIHYRILRSTRHMMQLSGRAPKRVIRTCSRYARRFILLVLAFCFRISPDKVRERLASTRNGHGQPDHPLNRRERFTRATLLFLVALPVAVERSVYWIGRGLLRSVKWAQRAVYTLVRRCLLLFHRPFCFFDFYVRAYRLVKESPSDVYHAHDFATLPVAWWAARKLGGALVYDSHEIYVEVSTITGLEKWGSALVERRMIRDADVVITVNWSAAKELATRYRVSKSEVVMNCPEFDYTTSRTNWLREALHLSAERQVVLYQGGFSPNRGLENLLLASAGFLPEAVLVFMGWGSIEGSLKSLAVEHRLLDSRVFFLEPVRQEILIQWTASADVGVIPYLPIGLNNTLCLPNKIFEYIAAGIPIAVSSLPELSRVINLHDIGVEFDPWDPKDMALRINDLLRDSEARQRMSENARQARREYNWSAEGARLLATYEALQS